MGHTIWVDVEGRAANELPNDNSIMLRLKDELDVLCEELGVTTLSSFCDYSELAANYAEEMDARANDLPSALWFESASGLKTIDAIANFLTQHPERLNFNDDSKRRHWRTALIRELNDSKSTLKGAATAARKFRFLIVP